MDLKKGLTTDLKLITNTNISEEYFKNLAENTFCTLIGSPEIHNITTLYNSKPDVVKGVYAILLTAAAEFCRNNFNKENVSSFLISQCNWNTNRANIFANLFNKNKQQLHINLGKIGSHFPHLVDVKWKIDYIIKSDRLDKAGGPLFRISLLADGYDQVKECKVVEHIEFSCNSQELQDLVYKLKDAVRHCQKLIGEH